MKDRLIWETSKNSNPMDVHDLLKTYKQERANFINNTKYWEYRQSSNALVHKETEYTVDLSLITTAESCVDRIAQVHGKSWLTVEGLVEFLNLFKYLVPIYINHGRETID